MIKEIFFADTIAICSVNTSKLHMHLECNYFICTFSYIVHTVMQWVACKSPMPLQAQDFVHVFMHMQWYSSRF